AATDDVPVLERDDPCRLPAGRPLDLGPHRRLEVPAAGRGGDERVPAGIGPLGPDRDLEAGRGAGREHVGHRAFSTGCGTGGAATATRPPERASDVSTASITRTTSTPISADERGAAPPVTASQKSVISSNSGSTASTCGERMSPVR